VSAVSPTTTEPLTGPSASIWRTPPVVLICAIALLIAAYWDTAKSILVMWAKNPLGHEYLVPAAVVWLAWRRRDDLRAMTPHPAFWWLPLLAVAAFGWLLGNLTNTTVVQQLCLAVMFVGLVWGSVGTAGVRPLIFPLGFLIFALPIGDWVVPALQNLTAWFAVKMLHLCGFPALLEAHVISIPGSRWQVAEACSGINYLMSSLVLAYLYAGLVYRTWPHRIGFFLASGLMALIANSIRVFVTILIASFGATQVAAGMEHYLIGWFVFCMIMALTFVTCGRWKEPEAPHADAPAPLPAHTPRRASAMSMWAFVALGLLIVGVAPLSARRVWTSQDDTDEIVPRSLVQVSGEWRPVDGGRFNWTPRYFQPTGETLQTYVSGEHAVAIYVAYYAAGERGAKLASSGNQLFTADWLPVAETSRSIAVGGQSFDAHETMAQAPNTSLVVWNWYWVDGTFTRHDAVAKLLLAKSRLLRSGRGSAAIAVAAQDLPGSDVSLVLRDFVAHLNVDSHDPSSQRP